MSKLVSVHSIQQGSGKSQVASNMAVLLANAGQRVALVDANIGSPSANSLFGLQDGAVPGLEDYLLGYCPIQATVRDLSAALATGPNGRLFVVSTSPDPRRTAALMQGEVPGDTLKSGLNDLDRDLQLDTLIVDTSSGLNDQTLLLMAMTSALAIVMLLDQYDYQGASTTIEVAHKLGVPQIGLIVNNVPAMYVRDQVKAEVEQTYNCPATVLPHSDELAALGGMGIFVLQYPDDPVTLALKEATAMLVA